MKEVKPTVEKTKSALAQGFATLGGFLAGHFAMALVEKYAPKVVADYSSALGLAGFVPHYVPGANDNWKSFGNGLIAAGGSDAIKKLTNNSSIGVVSMINSALPGRGTFPLTGLAGNMFPLRGLGASDQDARLLAGNPNNGGVKMLPDELLVA